MAVTRLCYQEFHCHQTERDLPFYFFLSRNQLLICLPFALTINNSQGQPLELTHMLFYAFVDYLRAKTLQLVT